MYFLALLGVGGAAAIHSHDRVHGRETLIDCLLNVSHPIVFDIVLKRRLMFGFRY